MSTTSVGYGQHPRRTAALVALVVASLTATTTGTGLVLAGPASAQPPTAAGAPVPPHHANPVEPSGAARYENLGAMARAVPRTAGLGSVHAVARSAPGASSPGPGP
ncbi:MAG TPA: hypothetical protein VN786_09560 [Acidimicrobiales bacterium]|nr:hypothetical protein [Acidimicrobiales bacterium]